MLSGSMQKGISQGCFQWFELIYCFYMKIESVDAQKKAFILFLKSYENSSFVLGVPLYFNTFTNNFK